MLRHRNERERSALLIVRTSISDRFRIIWSGQNGLLNFIVAIITGLPCDLIGRLPLFLASTTNPQFDLLNNAIGMTIFRTTQTVCLSLYSQNTGTGPTITVMIVVWLPTAVKIRYSAVLAFSPVDCVLSILSLYRLLIMVHIYSYASHLPCVWRVRDF